MKVPNETIMFKPVSFRTKKLLETFQNIGEPQNKTLIRNENIISSPGRKRSNEKPSRVNRRDEKFTSLNKEKNNPFPSIRNSS